MHELLNSIVSTVLELVANWGYLGIFIMMFIESSFVPFPSEIAMIPAGYLVSQGQMNAELVLLAGVGGSLCGAMLNYLLARYLGLPLFKKIGHYFFIREKHFDQADRYFASHGEITTFVCRLIPGVRQLISVPAGLAAMNIPRFLFFTGLGAGLWCCILVFVGYQAGAHEDLWRPMLESLMLWIVLALIVIIFAYLVFVKRRG